MSLRSSGAWLGECNTLAGPEMFSLLQSGGKWLGVSGSLPQLGWAALMSALFLWYQLDQSFSTFLML